MKKVSGSGRFHRIGRRWVTVSATLLALIGGIAVAGEVGRPAAAKATVRPAAAPPSYGDNSYLVPAKFSGSQNNSLGTVLVHLAKTGSGYRLTAGRMSNYSYCAVASSTATSGAVTYSTPELDNASGGVMVDGAGSLANARAASALTYRYTRAAVSASGSVAAPVEIKGGTGSARAVSGVSDEVALTGSYVYDGTSARVPDTGSVAKSGFRLAKSAVTDGGVTYGNPTLSLSGVKINGTGNVTGNLNVVLTPVASSGTVDYLNVNYQLFGSTVARTSGALKSSAVGQVKHGSLALPAGKIVAGEHGKSYRVAASVHVPVTGSAATSAVDVPVVPDAHDYARLALKASGVADKLEMVTANSPVTKLAAGLSGATNAEGIAGLTIPAGYAVAADQKVDVSNDSRAATAVQPVSLVNVARKSAEEQAGTVASRAASEASTAATESKKVAAAFTVADTRLSSANLTIADASGTVAEASRDAKRGDYSAAGSLADGALTTVRSVLPGAWLRSAAGGVQSAAVVTASAARLISAGSGAVERLVKDNSGDSVINSAVARLSGAARIVTSYANTVSLSANRTSGWIHDADDQSASVSGMSLAAGKIIAASSSAAPRQAVIHQPLLQVATRC